MVWRRAAAKAAALKCGNYWEQEPEEQEPEEHPPPPSSRLELT